MLNDEFVFSELLQICHYVS